MKLLVTGAEVDHVSQTVKRVKQFQQAGNNSDILPLMCEICGSLDAKCPIVFASESLSCVCLLFGADQVVHSQF